MMRARVALIFAIALGSVSGCRGDFVPATLLAGLRVLAIRANPAEVPPGSTATLDALVTVQAPDDGGTVAYDWRVCHETPILGEGNTNPDCVTLLDAGIVTPVSMSSTAQVTMPSVAPTALGLPDDTDGFYLPVVLRTTLGAEQIVSVFHLRYGIGMGVPPNNNPTLSSIEAVMAGIPDSADAGVGAASTMTLDPTTPFVVHLAAGKGSASLRASFTADSDESYPILTGTNGQVTETTETLTVSWYATFGQFSNPVTGQPKPLTTWSFDKYVPTDLPAGGLAGTLYAVARDERGGVDFTSRPVLLLP